MSTSEYASAEPGSFSPEEELTFETDQNEQTRLSRLLQILLRIAAFALLICSLAFGPASFITGEGLLAAYAVISFSGLLAFTACYFLIEKGYYQFAVKLDISSVGVLVAAASLVGGTQILVIIPIIGHIVLATIFASNRVVYLLGAAWTLFLAGLYSSQNLLLIYRPPFQISLELSTFINIVLVAVLLPLVVVLLGMSARSQSQALRTRNTRLNIMLSRQIQTEARLQENQQRLQATFEQVAVGIIHLSLAGEWLLVNYKYYDIVGYSPSELQQLSILDLHHPDDRLGLPDLFDRISKGQEQNIPFEKKLIHKSGAIVWVRVTASRVCAPNGEPKYLMLVCDDISARRQAQAALADEKERLAVTLRSIGEGVITTDTEGRISLLNPVAEKLTGWSQAEATSQLLPQVFKLVQEGTHEPLPNSAQLVLQTGASASLTGPTILINRDGSERYVSSNGAPIRDLSETVIGVVLVFRDVSQLQLIEAELRKSQKLESLGLLAGGIAHDFNNILTAIVGNIGLAKMEPSPDDFVYKVLDEAERAAFRAKDLTQQLITFSPGGYPDKKLALLPDLLVGPVTFILRGTQVNCDFKIAPDLWPVEVDAGQLNQVINNLVLNAQQAMPEGGLITIEAENIPGLEPVNHLPLSAGPYVRVSISDMGIGIPSRNLARIFDPYFTTKPTGSGLGLATSFSIINRHGGHIAVASEFGAGATFTIYLPALPGQLAPPPSA